MDGRLYALTKTKTDLDGLQEPAGGSRSIDKNQTYIDGAVIAPGTLPVDALPSHSLTTDYLDTTEVQAALVTKEQVETVLTGEVDTHNHSGLLPKPTNMPTPADGQVVTYNATNDDFELMTANAGFEVSTTYNPIIENYESENTVFPMSTAETWVRTNAVAHTGSYSLTNAFLYSGYAREVDITITVEEATALSFWAKRAYTNTYFKVSLNGIDLFNKTQGDANFDWTQFTATLIPGDNILHLYGYGGNVASGVLFVDDIQVGETTIQYNQSITEHSGIPDLTGNAGKVTVVNGTEDGLAFVDMPVFEEQMTGTATIPTIGWIANGGDYAYRLDLTITGILAEHIVSASINVADMTIALDAQICPTITSYDGGLTFYAKTVPVATIGFSYAYTDTPIENPGGQILMAGTNITMTQDSGANTLTISAADTAYQNAVSGGYIGNQTAFNTDLAAIEGLEAALVAIIGG